MDTIYLLQRFSCLCEEENLKDLLRASREGIRCHGSSQPSYLTKYQVRTGQRQGRAGADGWVLVCMKGLDSIGVPVDRQARGS